MVKANCIEDTAIYIYKAYCSRDTAPLILANMDKTNCSMETAL